MKKLLSIFLCFILLLTPLSAIPAQAETMPQLILGDGNLDGCIDAVDAMEALKVAVIKMDMSEHFQNPRSPKAIKMLLLDVDNSGGLTAKDALLILKYAVGKEVIFTRTMVPLPPEWESWDWQIGSGPY